MRFSSTPTSGGNRPPTIVVVAICKAGIVILLLVYWLLLVGQIYGLLYPKSNVGKFMAVTAYLMIVTFLTRKVYKLWSKRKHRKGHGGGRYPHRRPRSSA